MPDPDHPLCQLSRRPPSLSPSPPQIAATIREPTPDPNPTWHPLPPPPSAQQPRPLCRRRPPSPLAADSPPTAPLAAGAFPLRPTSCLQPSASPLVADLTRNPHPTALDHDLPFFSLIPFQISTASCRASHAADLHQHGHHLRPPPPPIRELPPPESDPPPSWSRHPQPACSQSVPSRSADVSPAEPLQSQTIATSDADFRLLRSATTGPLLESITTP